MQICKQFVGELPFCVYSNKRAEGGGGGLFEGEWCVCLFQFLEHLSVELSKVVLCLIMEKSGHHTVRVKEKGQTISTQWGSV